MWVALAQDTNAERTGKPVRLWRLMRERMRGPGDVVPEGWISRPARSLVKPMNESGDLVGD